MALWEMDWRRRETSIVNAPEEGFRESQLEYLAVLEKRGNIVKYVRGQDCKEFPTNWVQGGEREKKIENDPQASHSGGQMSVDVLTCHAPTAASLWLNYHRTLLAADGK